MFGFERWPLAVACLGLGVIGGFAAHQRLIGQPPAVDPPPMVRELASFSSVVKRVLPAAVSIEAKSTASVKGTTKPSLPDTQDPEPGFGSGVLIDPTGVVLTNNHVVLDGDAVEVTLADGRKFTSRDIRHDPKSDLAVIKLEVKDPVPFLELGDSDAMEVGDRVLAIGSPFGLTGSVTHGIVSGKSRTNLRLNPYEDWLQTDAAVNPGSSGGPLVNMQGQVVGITAAIKTRNGGFSGVGLSVASNLCKTVSAQLLKAGVVRRGYLGANVQALDEVAALRLGVKPGEGVLATRVYENSPAAKAGLLSGDAIATVAGLTVRNPRDLQRIVTALPIGQIAEAAILRDKKPLVLKVTIEEQPAAYGVLSSFGREPAPAAPMPAPVQGAIVPFQSYGIAVTDLTMESIARLGYPKDTVGVLVVAVTRDGPADRAGLRIGQVIVKVEKVAVPSAAAFRQALSLADREKGSLLHMLRPTGEIDFAVLKVP